MLESFQRVGHKVCGSVLLPSWCSGIRYVSQAHNELLIFPFLKLRYQTFDGNNRSSLSSLNFFSTISITLAIINPIQACKLRDKQKIISRYDNCTAMGFWRQSAARNRVVIIMTWMMYATDMPGDNTDFTNSDSVQHDSDKSRNIQQCMTDTSRKTPFNLYGHKCNCIKKLLWKYLISIHLRSCPCLIFLYI